MPGYIKIYYAFAIYLIFCVAVSAVALTYNVVIDYTSHNIDEIIIDSVTYIGLAIALLKGVISLKACRRYSKAIPLTIAQQDVFMATYFYIIFFAAGTLLYSVFTLPEYFGQFRHAFRRHPGEVIINTGIALLAITGIYFSITDLILLKAIRKKHEESLLSFEVQGGN